MTVKIIGFGWVGKAMRTLFPNALVYDPILGFVENQHTDVAFVCVPTPLKDGTLDMSTVMAAVENCDSDLIIIRSTTIPGTCDSMELLYEKDIVFQPEYLGETPNHPFTDQHARPFMIIGGRPENRRKAINVYQTAYNANITIRQMTNYEAEVVKLSENRAIAFKVAQCQELYDVCEKAGIDYYTIRDAVYGDDPRFNLWWTFIYPWQRGFNSKCIPKDVYGWAAWAESLGYCPELTNTMLRVNNGYIS